MRKLHGLFVVFSFIAMLGCSSPTAASSATLRVAALSGQLTIENPHDWPVFYLIVNPNFLALADFALCSDPASSCPRVPPHATIRVPYDQIAGYEAGETTATLWQWRLRLKNGGGYEQTDFEAVQIPLR